MTSDNRCSLMVIFFILRSLAINFRKRTINNFEMRCHADILHMVSPCFTLRRKFWEKTDSLLLSLTLALCLMVLLTSVTAVYWRYQFVATCCAKMQSVLMCRMTPASTLIIIIIIILAMGMYKCSMPMQGRPMPASFSSSCFSPMLSGSVLSNLLRTAVRHRLGL